jgi:predicted ATPase
MIKHRGRSILDRMDDERHNLNEMVQLYGRQEEITLIESSYENSISNSHVIWLHGQPGVGKTALVECCMKNKLHYCSGRFECSTSSQPFSAIKSIFQCICLHWRSEEYPKVQVGPEIASILSSFKPEITNILLPRKELNESFRSLSIQKIVNKPDEWGFFKLKQAIRALMKGVCKVLETASVFPLIVYLDDLQWADEASLEIIHTFLSDDGLLQGFLFIGSFRDNNPSEYPHLLSLIKSIEEKNLLVHDILLRPLTLRDFKFLISDLFDSPLHSCERVAEIIHSKTLGNPFFATNLIKRLQDKNVRSETEEGIPFWEWSDSKIYDAIGVIESIEDHFLQSLLKLPSTTIEILKLASFLGSTVDLPILEAILRHFQINLLSVELNCILESAVLQDVITFRRNKIALAFSHDGIHRAFYHLEQSENSRKLIHLEIGRCLLDVENDLSLIPSESKLLLIVNQLNLGRQMVHGDKEQLELVNLNFCAAEYMITLSAFRIAQEYLEISLEVLGCNRWKSHYDLTLKVSNLLSTILLGNGLMEETSGLVDEIFHHAICEDDQIGAQILRLQILACVNRLEECLEAGMKVLCSLGHRRLPKNPNLFHIIPLFSKIRRRMKNMKDEDILCLKVCDDKRIFSILEVCKFTL